MDPRSTTHLIYGQLWYPYFISRPDRKGLCLLDMYEISSLKGKFCVTFAVQSPTGQTVLLFSVFNTYYEFYSYQLNFIPRRRCFFEYVLGRFPQKPHFDIDIDRLKEEITITDAQILGENVKDELITSIITVLKHVNIEIKLEDNILVLPSHSDNKRSYHVIINGLCHDSNIEAKAFYFKCLDYVQEKYRKYIDIAVYSEKQQFRILGSQKILSNRPKIFLQKWSYKGKDVYHKYPQLTLVTEDGKLLYELESSLVSHTVNCKFLPSFISETSKKEYFNSEITEEDALESIKMYANKIHIAYDSSRFPFRIESIKENFILLKKNGRTACIICSRYHEHENPFISISGPEKTVIFSCRRSKTLLYLGKLNPEDNLCNELIDSIISEFSNTNSDTTEEDLKELDEISTKSSKSSKSRETSKEQETVCIKDDIKLRRKFLFEALKKSNLKKKNDKKMYFKY